VWDEDSGELHRELEGFPGFHVNALATFLSADGQQPRAVAGSSHGHVRVYDPEAGSVLHRLDDHTEWTTDLACIASSSVAPHHPRLVSTSWDGTAKVWDGETGELLADLGGHQELVMSVAVWKEHTGGHDRIATGDREGRVRVWDGEASTLLHDLDCGNGSAINSVSAFKSAGGPYHVLVHTEAEHADELQVWDPEEGRLLHDGINRGCPADFIHMFESAQGRYLLAVVGHGDHHARHPGDTVRGFLDVWDLGEAPAGEHPLRPAHKHG
jgi:WD40 repeat protein